MSDHHHHVHINHQPVHPLMALFGAHHGAPDATLDRLVNEVVSIRKLLQRLVHSPRRLVGIITAGPLQPQEAPMPPTIPDSEDISIPNAGGSKLLTASFKDIQGNDAQVEDGSARWALDHPEMGTVTQEPGNQLQARIRGAAATNGDCIVTCTADADLGSGVQTVACHANIHVTNPMAFGGVIAAGQLEAD